jgi:Na+/H+ antiporter NhaC
MASGCDHIEHVRTQLPYAFIVGTVAIGAGSIPGGFGFPPLASILIGFVALVAALYFFGRAADAAAPETGGAAG